MAAQSFGKYVISRRLGSGGMAEVYLAHDPLLDRDVAIKVIYPNLVAESEFEERFRREARLVASLRHPNVVHVYDFDLGNSGPFLVMEFLDGGTLKDRLAELRNRKEVMPLEETNALLIAMGSALDYAHGRGLVHRDLKPANILFTNKDEPVISDFGIAKILGESGQLTMTGHPVGTPAYMSPEQATSKPIDRRSDIYSLGIILYEMVTGAVPFKGESTTAVMLQHLTTPPPSPRSMNPSLPPAVESVILKALAKNPEDRFASAGELARALDSALRTPVVTPGPDDATLVESDDKTITRAAVPADPSTMIAPVTSRATAAESKPPEPAPPAQPVKPVAGARPTPIQPEKPVIGSNPVTPRNSVSTPVSAQANVQKSAEGAAGAAGVSALPRPASATLGKIDRKLIAIAAGVVVLVLIIGGVFVMDRMNGPTTVVIVPNGATPEGGSSVPPGQAQSTVVAGMNMTGGTPGSGAAAATGEEIGLVRFSDVAGIADQAVVSLTHVAPPPANRRYEAWLVGKGGESRISLGKLDVDAKGAGQLTYVDKDGQNLIARFDRFELTLEPNPDPSPLPSGDVAYSSAVPPGAMAHIRHLLSAFDDTPKNVGLTVGAFRDAKLLNQAAKDMLDANQKNDFERVLIDAETCINIIEGKQGNHYGDLDRNGVVSDPSDGYGLLLNGKNQGYIEGTIDHANLASASPDATAEIRMHSVHVNVAAKNMEDWATQIRDRSLAILASQNNGAAKNDILTVASLGDRFLNGIDINGNEQIDPLPGEAGAKLAYDHAFYMADMPILSGANAMPTPGPK